jgi:hypothetical protein
MQLQLTVARHVQDLALIDGHLRISDVVELGQVRVVQIPPCSQLQYIEEVGNRGNSLEHLTSDLLSLTPAGQGVLLGTQS